RVAAFVRRAMKIALRTPAMTRTKARRMSVSEFETGLARAGTRDVFRDDELIGLPAPVQRYFRAAIAPSTPLALAARLEMHGSIKIGGRWLPFRATEVLAPHRSFLWSARVSGALHRVHCVPSHGPEQGQVVSTCTGARARPIRVRDLSGFPTGLCAHCRREPA